MARCNVCGKNVHSGLVIDKECLEKLKSWNGRCDELFNEIKARDKIIAEYDDKIERGELVEVVRCGDCFYRASKKYEYDYCEPGETYCNVNDRDVLLNFYCGYGKNKLSCTDDERSGENEND